MKYVYCDDKTFNKNDWYKHTFRRGMVKYLVNLRKVTHIIQPSINILYMNIGADSLYLRPHPTPGTTPSLPSIHTTEALTPGRTGFP